MAQTAPAEIAGTEIEQDDLVRIGVRHGHDVRGFVKAVAHDGTAPVAVLSCFGLTFRLEVEPFGDRYILNGGDASDASLVTDLTVMA